MAPNRTVGADRPLVDPRDDVLGYAPFAKQLAHTLLRNSPADGFVIAIYGAWGTGKSTALNFVTHYMERDPDADAPIIVRFNPWWFAGGEDLVRRFFAQFESAVFAARAKKKKLKSAFEKFASAVADVPFAPVQAAGKVAATTVRATQTTDLMKLKEELSSELAKQPQRIVVIMDDIDRLVVDEVRQLFRLIKAVADFPNVTYLLAFDREVASRALSEVHGGRGPAYLEKIVQAPFELPLPDRTQLRTLLTDRIGQVVGDIPDDFNKVYWGNVFLDGIDPFVTKPRDMVRLVNALAVTLPAVKDDVNIVDFIALETLRVFSPAAYDIVRSNPDKFLTRLADRWGIEDTRADLRAFHDGWLGALGEEQVRVQSLLVRLFPRLESVWEKRLGATVYSNKFILEWRQKKRVCSPEHFHVYFQLSLPQGAISSAEFKGALADEHLTELATRLRNLATEKRADGSTRASAMLERLRDYALDESSNAAAHASYVLQALFDAGDYIVAQASGRRSFLEVDDEMRLESAVRSFIQRVPHSERFEILKRAVENGSALGTVVAWVAGLVQALRKHDGNAATQEEQILDAAEEVEQLEQLLQARLTAASTDGTLWKVPRLLGTLSAWGSLTDREPLVHWLRVQTADDTRLAQVLEHFVAHSFSMGMNDRVSQSAMYVDLQSIESFFDVDRLVSRLRLILQRSEWSEQQRVAMRLTVEAYERRAAGKPDRFR